MRHFYENMPPSPWEEKDIYHSTVKIALEKHGWKITDDPFSSTLSDKTRSI